MKLRLLLPVILFLLVLQACTKEARNERRLGGIWEGTKVQYLTYDSLNNLLKDSTVDNSGALYLYDDAELFNQFRYSLDIVPYTFTYYDYWEGNPGDPHTLLGLNIRKLTRRKMELAQHTTDGLWNLQQTVIYYFERQ